MGGWLGPGEQLGEGQVGELWVGRDRPVVPKGAGEKGEVGFFVESDRFHAPIRAGWCEETMNGR